MTTAQVVTLTQMKSHKLGIIVSISSLVLISITLYSLHLQIKHTKMQIADKEKESENKGT